LLIFRHKPLPRGYPRSGEPAAGGRLERLTARSKAVLLLERMWRAILPPLVVAGAFVSLSWTGIWLDAPSWARGVGIGLLALSLSASLLPARKFRWPRRKEALERIDDVSGLLSLRPAASLADRLGNGARDPVTLALWNLHRRRAEEAVALLRNGWPSPRAAEHDRYALRAIVLVALVATAFVAGPQKYARLAAAFNWHFDAGGGTDARVDAWIDPPAYTGITPILLNLSKSQSFFSREEPKVVAAPANSIAVIHASAGKLDLEVKGGLVDVAADSGASVKADADARSNSAAARPQGTTERRLALRGDAVVTIRNSGVRLGTFSIHAIADEPPSIALTAAPKFNLRGSFTLKYRVADDYGVMGAEAVFAKPVLPGGRAAARSLADPPRVPLNLPPPPYKKAATTIDLSDHPWAGASVEMTLTAHDEGGNAGSSLSTWIILPQKPFANPLARALAEQRRSLVLVPEDKVRVAHALEALMLAPDSFGTSTGVYLGLRVALDRLNAAQDDSELLEVAGMLWEMAQNIESGDLSAAERDLRAAERDLREAVARGAAEEEIGRLSENLRAAMDKFLQQLAAQQSESKEPTGPEGRFGQSRFIRPEDLQKMVGDLQAMLRSGDTVNAQKLLEQLQDVLENLRLARPRQPNRGAQELNRALDELGRLSQDQQDLRDETYQSGQEERLLQRGLHEDDELLPGQTLDDFFGRPSSGDSAQISRGEGHNGQSKSGNSPQAGAGTTQLAKRQKELRGRIKDLQDRLAGAGSGDLDAATDAMIAAENALRDGPRSNGAAVEAQGRAVEALREGAQKLAERMNGQGDGESPGAEDEGEGAAQPFGTAGGIDPLGRPVGRDNGYANFPEGYNPGAASPSERARRVLEELRRRLGEPARPREEMDYLQRLLRRY
jgi:uncharacterized protein (TIGR02302 family)